jgi:hypothetical protein
MDSTDAVPEGPTPPSRSAAPVGPTTGVAGDAADVGELNLTEPAATSGSEPGGDAEAGRQPLPVAAELPPVRVTVQELTGTSYKVLARPASGWVETDSSSVLTGVLVQHNGRAGITKGPVKRNGEARKVQWSDDSSDSWVVAERLHVFTHLAPSVSDLKAGINEHLGGELEPDAQHLETASGQVLDEDTMALSEVAVVDGSVVRLQLQAAAIGREKRKEREAARVAAAAEQQRAAEAVRRAAARRAAALALPWALLLLCGGVLQQAGGWSLWRYHALWCTLVGLPVALLGAHGFDRWVPAHSAAHWEDRPMTEEENLKQYRWAIDYNRRENLRETDFDYVPPTRTGGHTMGRRHCLHVGVCCYAILGVVAMLISLLVCPTTGTVRTRHGWLNPATTLMVCTNDCLYNPQYTGGCGWDGCTCSQADVELFDERDSGSDRDGGGDFTMEGFSTGCLACIVQERQDLEYKRGRSSTREAEAAATCILSVETAPDSDDQQNNATTRAPSSYSPHRWLGDGCVCDSDEAAACGGCGITIGDCEEMLTHTTHSLL